MPGVESGRRRDLGVPGSAPAPALPRSPHFAVPDDPSLAWPEAVCALERAHGDRFEALADALIDARDRDRRKVILFTGCHRSEGRTTLVLTLARALARRPGRTLVVDADLTGPMIARLLGLRPRRGLDDVIEGTCAVDDALIESADDHLTVLPLRGPVAQPREFLAAPAWSCTLARLRREFDLVLLDGSPLFSGLSAAVLHRSADAAVLVASRALTSERALGRALEVLEAGDLPVLGLAHTFD